MSLHTAIPVLVDPAEIETLVTSSESNRNDKADLNVGRAQVPEPQKKPLHRSVSSSGEGNQRPQRSKRFLLSDQQSSFSKSTASSPVPLQRSSSLTNTAPPPVPLQRSSFSKRTVSSRSQLEPPIFRSQPPRNAAAPRTDAPSCYKIAGWWIEECLKNHPLCASTRAAYGSNK
jgi:hypothetical protein